MGYLVALQVKAPQGLGKDKKLFIHLKKGLSVLDGHYGGKHRDTKVQLVAGQSVSKKSGL